MKLRKRLERALIRLMAMEVHPVVYLCLLICVWYSAVTILNGFAPDPQESFVFMGEPLLNLIVGSVGITAGLALIIALRYTRWRSSSVLSLANISAWSFTLIVLVAAGAWAGVVFALFCVLLNLYIALASEIHLIYGYPQTKSPRQEFYENQKQARLRDSSED